MDRSLVSDVVVDNDKETLDKSIQDALNKLISDEWFAGHIYKQFILLVKADDRAKIASQMLDIANDEIDDHLKSLVEFALSYGFSVPSTYNEMKKFADKDDIKLFESCKKDEDALFYIEKGIESEKRAIEAYQVYVDDYNFAHDYTDMKLIVQNNYYDELDHLHTLEFMKDSIEALQKYM